MRILHIISALASGGAEIYVRDLAEQMVRDGHDVCIAYVSDAAALGRSMDFQEEFKTQLAHNGVLCQEIGYDCRRWLWRGGARLRRTVERFRPDIIHAHLYFGIFFAVFARVAVPLVYTNHLYSLGKGQYLYPLLNMFVDRYVGISNDCAETLRLKEATHVTVIYNAVNANRLLVKNIWLSQEKINLIAVGRLSAQKNHAMLIDAIRILFRRRNELRNDVSLKIVGEGPLKEELQKQIDRSGLTDQITLLGNRSDIPELLHHSDIFILSSDYEGLPISLLEAMMTGLPVIVTDVGGCRDVVETCAAGSVVPLRNADALVDALEQMLTNDSLRQKYGKNSYLNSQQRFHITSASRAHYTLYTELLESKMVDKQRQ